MAEDSTVNPPADATSAAAAPAAAAESELTLEEREKLAEAQAAKQREGISGFESPPAAEDLPPDPRAEKRAELLRQLAALDEQPTDFTRLSSADLLMAFLDGVHQLLGSHPKLDAIINELRVRAPKL